MSPVLPLSRFRLLLSLAAAVGACLAGPAHGQSLITSRGALSSNDHVDWAVLGDRATRVSDPFSLVSSQGAPVIVSQTGQGMGSQSGGAFATIRQAGTPLAEGTINGNFAPGDVLLDAQDGGTVSLTFPHGVYGGGAQIAAPRPTPSGAGAFTVQIQAFRRDNTLLASFTKSGTFSASADNSAPFLGIADTSPDIYRISYTGATAHNGLFLNRFDIAAPQAASRAGHTHVLWNNPDGRVMLWSVAPDGSHTASAFGPFDDGAPGAPWHATALATGPDGLSHILWNNPDGRVMLWIVDDAGHFSSAFYGPYTDPGFRPSVVITPSTPWSATALSVGPDNVTHILWNNTDGKVALWTLDSRGGHAATFYGPFIEGPGSAWSAKALAVGPDNVPHVLWNNTDKRASLWNVDASGRFTTLGTYGPFTEGTGSVWSATALSVGPDNVLHVLWNNTDARASLWNVGASGNFATLGTYGPFIEGPGSVWLAAALSVGPDSVPHVLWDNTDGRASLWNVGADGRFVTLGTYGPFTDGLPPMPWTATAVASGP